MKRSIAFVVLVTLAIILFFYCNPSKKNSGSQAGYKNLGDTVKYVGMQTCMTCHSNIHATFIHTGMGESWDHATKEKSSAEFNHAYVHDPVRNFWYHPFWKNDSLYIKEFRVEGKDTTYQRIEKISYIVGSGQHTNSHIWSENSYLYQAPMTFYTQEGVWDLPPGFSDGTNTRWNRVISVECMNCHNMYPEFDAQSENKFLTVKTGIECERCHGPGEVHVNEKLKGIVVDTSKYIDYSIVNPKKLPRDLQVELCQRCHLQGISVLNEGKTFFDFKPGMKESDVINVFMPRYEGNPDQFIMASHADRMKQSKCYQNSDMTCLTCHNPHVSVKVVGDAHFNSACQSCHSGTKDCTLPMAARMKQNNNCYQCHMPVSSTIDIPHVTVHDHRIQIPVTDEKKDAILKFVGLECLTTKSPGDLLMVQGYLQTFEAFSAQPFLLDSAWNRLQKVNDKNDPVYRRELIRYYYLKNDYADVISNSKNISAASISDAWTAYRIGESYYQTSDWNHALGFYNRAVELEGDNPEFENKYGNALVQLNRIDEAQKVFLTITQQVSKYAPAQCNLGWTYFLQGDFTFADTLFNRALALDPDYEQALMNKGALLITQRKNDEAKKYFERALAIDPKNEKAKLVLQQLKSF